MTTLIGFGIVLLAATSFVVQIWAVRRSGLTARSPLVFVGLVLVMLASLLYEAGMLIRGQAGQLSIIALMLMIVLIAASKSIRSRMTHQISLAAFLPAFIAAALFSVNALMNAEIALQQILGRSLGILSLALLGFVFCLSKLQLRDVAAAMVLAISLMFAMSPLKGLSWRPCDKFKCGPFDALYTGPFQSENTVALLCGIGVLCAFLTYRDRKSVIVILTFALTLYATESRTSQLALAVGVAVWPLAAIATSWCRKATTSRALTERSRLLIVWASLGTVALFIVGFWLVVEAEPSDFSNRGNVWILGLSALGEDWVSGLGVDRWYTYQSVGAVPSHFPHSEYLFLLFTGGVGAVLGLFWIYTKSLSNSFFHHRATPFAVSYIVFLGVTGMTELFWNPIAADGNALVMLPLIFLLSITKTKGSIATQGTTPALQDQRRSHTHTHLTPRHNRS
ncbi:O-antigen ligase [Pseudarthrobacter sp. NamE5]|uniref:O-antigen ligase family protein n=1 Tax=Pseudarthrobacter sp. NamE5 TaxID=2576839 RepID=UPI00110B0E6E|nr:O-antigen ligase family protein [Pseudarthrobacter sp. NamE5]TLM81685.1 O-antigen ligase family protein [Pseudarthrobacter sp. NamE5]